MFSGIEVIDAEMHGWPLSADLAESCTSRLDLQTEINLAAMDAAGVDAMVMPAHDAFAEWAATRVPGRFASFVRAPFAFDPDAPDLDEAVAHLRQKPGVLGIRAMLAIPRSGENIQRLHSGGWERLFSAAERHNVPVCIFISGNLPLAEGIARAHPDLTLIIDHIGIDQPPLSVPADPPWGPLPHLLKLAQYPKVGVKFSGAPTLSKEPYPFRDLWPHLSQVVEAFGPKRLMWGSDIARCMGFEGLVDKRDISVRDQSFPWQHTYAQAIHYILDSTELSASDKEWIFARTLRQLLRWPWVEREPIRRTSHDGRDSSLDTSVSSAGTG